MKANEIRSFINGSPKEEGGDVPKGYWLAEIAAQLAELKMPSIAEMFTPRVYLDGNQWCALYGVNLQEGVAGFGDTPLAAVTDYVKNFMSQRAPQRAVPPVKLEYVVTAAADLGAGLHAFTDHVTVTIDSGVVNEDAADHFRQSLAEYYDVSVGSVATKQEYEAELAREREQMKGQEA